MTENKLGGRGQCCYCGNMENNVSYHEAWECHDRPEEKSCREYDIAAGDDALIMAAIICCCCT